MASSISAVASVRRLIFMPTGAPSAFNSTLASTVSKSMPPVDARFTARTFEICKAVLRRGFAMSTAF